jgi:hypothetical protein
VNLAEHNTVDKLLNTITNAINSDLEEIIQYKDAVILA